MPTSPNPWMNILVEFSNLPNLWVMDFLERAQRGQLVEGQRHQLMALLLASEGQLEVFFGQIATTLEPDAREELLARLNYDLGHIRTSLERVEAAQPNTKANLKKVLEANQDCMPAAQAPKVWPANARKGEDPFQRMWDQNQENRQKEAEKFAMDLLKQREQIHLRNQKRSAKRMEVADEIAKERRKSL